MKSPTDKKNDTIQIIVTRACQLQCSNCTQLLPFRRDAKHMSTAVFREAVTSLVDWPGIVALFGGNPCTHPEFPELCEIITELIPPNRRGLWSNNLGKHGQIAADTFGRGRLNLNAHADEDAAAEIDRWFPGRLIESSRKTASWHSPILMDRRDIGMGDAEWVEAREKCDINLRWSAAIREHDGHAVGYFCEVAASLDGVRGENHGIPVVAGWWRWKMDQFDNQVKRCCDRGCGVPLKGLGHLDRDDTYDITESWVPLTLDRPKRVLTQVHTTMPATTEIPTDYQSRWSSKTGAI